MNSARSETLFFHKKCLYSSSEVGLVKPNGVGKGVKRRFLFIGLKKSSHCAI